ncbi:Rieske (2Fe-2S) protein [Wenzhouxiangella marina]|uniref:Ferredoxin n=1 Tax=Wenzhouxiangella marina TaxID=1579979 RepID=A0A0K0XSU7_9GAMM|nr:Rieske 2Fe-2S domain-containing protein [Wenzhouxiangella marina]AKS40758.1 Ferredoxin [Wenzhouxiangella marina]MBB6087631.1 nitrite reductase/ring-hydroxylating ferredoxin subunit [Wenzhouxiangella marina]
MDEAKFLCDSNQLVEGQYVELQIDMDRGPMFMVGTRHRGEPRVWMNSCPHQGRPLNWAPNQFLKDDQGQLVCAAHGAVFEPDAGLCVSGPCRNASLTPVEVRELDGRIQLEPCAPEG